MTRFERAEVKKYSEDVYYYGANATQHKIRAPAPSDLVEKPSFGRKKQGSKKRSLFTEIAEEFYDDESGNYKGIQGDHIAYRYEVLSLLGTGSFGNVFKVLDHKTKKEKALKILKNFKDETNQVDLEIDILGYIRDRGLNQYIIKMDNEFTFRTHPCMTMEILDCNLYEVIKQSGYVGMDMDVIRRITT